MGTGIVFPICALPFSLLILVLFYIKGHVQNEDTRIFKLLIVSNFIGLILEMLCTYASIIYDTNRVLSCIIYKGYLIYLVVWLGLLLSYLQSITTSKTFDNNKKTKNILRILLVIEAILIGCLDVKLAGVDFSHRYTNGMAVVFTYLVSTIDIVIIIFLLIINRKKIMQIKYLPILIFLIFGLICTGIQMYNPSILLMTYAETFICCLMYFTIENPDVRMLEELLKNRELASSSFEDKSTFLFNMSQRIKEPVYRISDSVKEYQNTTKKEIKESAIDSIEQESRKLTFTVNDLLNVNSLDANKIKITNSYYNTYNFFEDIKKKAEYAIAKKSNVDFYFEIAKTLPDEFYGDSVKLKQVIMSVINNSIKFTDSGSVQVFVDAISRYDASRLFISIKDTGCGMSLEKVNELLSLKESETEEDKDVVKLDVKLKSAIKIIRLLGGNINIKSTENVGTELIIVLDQRIRLDSKNDKKKDNILNTYSNQLLADKMILLVDDDSDELNKLSGFFESKGYHTSICMYGKECIDRIKAGEKYKFILMKDEMNPDNALPVLNELKTLGKFKTPVIIMLNENKMFLKEHYIKDGFDDCLLLDDFTNELNRIIDKYFN